MATNKQTYHSDYSIQTRNNSDYWKHGMTSQNSQCKNNGGQKPFCVENMSEAVTSLI